MKTFINQHQAESEKFVFLKNLMESKRFRFVEHNYCLQ